MEEAIYKTSEVFEDFFNGSRFVFAIESF